MLIVLLGPGQGAETSNAFLAHNTAPGKHDGSGSERNSGSSGSAAEGQRGAPPGRGECPARVPLARAGSGLDQATLSVCSAGGVAADPRRGIRAELVLSSPAVTEGKNFQLDGR